MSTVVGSAAGNDDLFMFVEKVGKSKKKMTNFPFETLFGNQIFVFGKIENIKVRFFELDDDQVIWEDWGKFTEADVHHQYAIALKTPPYRKTSIDESVRAFSPFQIVIASNSDAILLTQIHITLYLCR